MTEEIRSPYPPVLNFTPEVESAKAAFAAFSFDSFASAQPEAFDLELLAHDIVRFAPELAMQLMSLGMDKMAEAA